MTRVRAFGDARQRVGEAVDGLRWFPPGRGVSVRPRADPATPVGPAGSSFDSQVATGLAIVRIRWVAVLLSVAHAVTVAPRVWRPSLVLLALALGAYNLWLRRLRQMLARRAQVAMAAAVAADFVVVAATELATLGRPDVVHWPVFMIISLEAAVLFGWKGTWAFLASFIPWFIGTTALADLWFGLSPTVQEFRDGTEMVVVMALLAGATAASSWKRQASTEAARAESQARADRLAALNQITHGIGLELREKAVVEATLGPIHRLFPEQWHGVLFDDGAGEAHLAEADGLPQRLRTGWLAGLGPIQREVLTVPDLLSFRTGSSPDRSAPVEWERFRSALIVPLNTPKCRLGWLVALDLTAGAFDASDAALFEGIGKQLSLALDNARVHQEVERLAVTDALTGLANRRALDAQIQHDMPVTFLEIDLDGFKAINDVYGHEAGDAVLVETARRIEGATRADDLVVRLGGDEFLVYLQRQLSEDEARALATRIAFLIEQPIDIGGHSIAVGASVGTAVGLSSDDPDELFKRADAEMYAVKRLRAHARAT